MATISLLRSVGAAKVLRLAGPQLLRQGGVLAPATSTLIPKKTLYLSPAIKARQYGPMEEKMPSDTGHWMKERYVAAALVPLIPLAIAVPNPVLDYSLSAVLVLHIHWAFEGIATDYIHGSLNKVAKGAILGLSILAFAGLVNLNYNDIGFGKAVQQIFTEL